MYVKRHYFMQYQKACSIYVIIIPRGTLWNQPKFNLILQVYASGTRQLWATSCCRVPYLDSALQFVPAQIRGHHIFHIINLDTSWLSSYFPFRKSMFTDCSVHCKIYLSHCIHHIQNENHILYCICLWLYQLGIVSLLLNSSIHEFEYDSYHIEQC